MKKEDRLFIYQEGLRLMKENPTWGTPDVWEDGLCFILGDISKKMGYRHGWTLDWSPEIMAQKPSGVGEGDYWWDTREERIAVLEKAIVLLSDSVE